jgi:hypothetical protein
MPKAKPPMFSIMFMAVEWTAHTMPTIDCSHVYISPQYRPDRHAKAARGSFHTSPHVQFLKALIIDLQVLSITSLKFH